MSRQDTSYGIRDYQQVISGSSAGTEKAYGTIAARRIR